MPEMITRQVGGDHYEKVAIQPFTLSLANGYDSAIHTIIKYVHRHDDKGGKQDLEKAMNVCYIRVRETERWGPPPIARTQLPIFDYTSQNVIPPREAEIIHMAHRWFLGVPAGVTHADAAAAISDRIAALIKHHYG